MSVAIRGLIEGFYDRVWTWEERRRVVDFIAPRGFDTFVYAPKTDRLQNTEWRTPYPADQRAELRAFGERLRGAGMAFWMGLRPVGISYVEPGDATLLVDKLAAYLDLGADRLVILADDIPLELDERSATRFESLADAHTWLVELVLARLELAPEQVAFVPTEYHGPGSAYLATLGAELPSTVDLCWTGPEVCSHSITRDDADGIAKLLQRPPLVWDNSPVNDAGMLGELHIGPIRGRDPTLGEATRGILVNPALEPEATLIALATWSEYLCYPEEYDADAAWWRALDVVAGEAAADVALLAAAHDRSPIRQGWVAPAPARLAEAVESIRAMSNRRLAADLAPFLEAPAR